MVVERGRAIMWSSVSIVVACAVTSSAVAESSSPSRDEVVAALQERDRRLYSLKLEYREVSRGGSIESPVAGGYTRRVVAVRRPDWFMRDNGHGHAEMHWADDPLRKTLLVTPERWRVFSHLNRVLDEGPVQDEVPADVSRELLFRVLCWWPFDDSPVPQVFGRPWSMERLMASDAYRLREGVESVDGRACLVLEIPDVDVLWIDRERPACVLRREVHNADTRAVSMRFELSDYRAFGPQLWLPGAFRNQQFDAYAHTPERQQRCVVDSRFVVSDVVVNEDVGEEVFRLPLPPGVVRYEPSGDEMEVTAVTDGHAEHLDSVLDWSRRLLSATSPEKEPYQYGALFGLPFGFAAAWLLMAAALPRRRRRQDEAGNPPAEGAERAPHESGEP